MDNQGLKQRTASGGTRPQRTVMEGIKIALYGEPGESWHPSGDAKHGGHTQTLRLLAFVTYFLGSCVSIFCTQILGSWLYFVDKDWFYAYMALTKESFGLLVTTMTQWWSPTTIRVSGDDSMAGQLRQTSDGRLECHFPSRMVLIANHQLYFDWLYLWWIGYTNTPHRMHGHLYIILKESLKHIPIVGQGMQFFGFIFMSRKMATDKPRLAHRLNKLKDLAKPMWLLVFPEGTNLSRNGRVNSAKWAEKQGIEDLRHLLLPRSTGSFFIFNQLKGNVEWVYDCTVAYEGIPRGKFGQDFFTLKTAYLEGRPPKSVNMYWRRIALSTIPLDDEKEFGEWMVKQWRIKDDLMEQYIATGRFPASKDAVMEKKGGFIETDVRPKHWYEVFNIFKVLAAFALIFNVLAKCYNVVVYGNMEGYAY